jgi:hypothetical protein
MRFVKKLAAGLIAHAVFGLYSAATIVAMAAAYYSLRGDAESHLHLVGNSAPSSIRRGMATSKYSVFPGVTFTDRYYRPIIE